MWQAKAAARRSRSDRLDGVTDRRHRSGDQRRLAASLYAANAATSQRNAIWDNYYAFYVLSRYEAKISAP